MVCHEVMEQDRPDKGPEPDADAAPAAAVAVRARVRANGPDEAKVRDKDRDKDAAKAQAGAAVEKAADAAPPKEDESMPGGDGTGPMGQGPMTGRAAGFCAGYAVPGYMNAFPGRGFGFGRGRGGFGGGRGWRHRFWATGVPGWAAAWGAPPSHAPETGAAPADERAFLEEQVHVMEQRVEALRKRLDSLSE